MTDHPRATLMLLTAFLLACAACASAPKPLPVDATKEQITVLQKQLLELQNVQNEMRRKMQEQAGVTDALASRIKSLEDRRFVAEVPPSPTRISSKSTGTSQVTPEKKRPSNKQAKKKKKKPVRRQVQ